MQHTDKYSFNLIERDDVFSPDALNENARKAETALEAVAAQAAAEAAARETADGALDQRLTVLEGRRLVVGAYTGNGDKNGMHVELGFTPAALLFPHNLGMIYVAPDCPYSPSPLQIALQIEEGGFFAKNDWNSIYTRPFIAIL